MEQKFPFGLDFQNKIMALLLSDRRFLAKHRDVIKAGYFDNEILAGLCQILLEFYDTYKTTPTIESIKELVSQANDKALYYAILDKLIQIDLSDSEFVESEVVDFVKQQALRKAMSKSTGFVKERDFDKAQEILLEAFNIGTDYEDLGMDYFASAQDRLLAYRGDTSRERRIATLIPEIDDVLGGGIYPGELNVLLGPPKRGKSIWLVNMASAALWQGKKVLYVTLEMAPEKIALRLDARLAGIPTRELGENYEEVCKKLEAVHKRFRGEVIIKKYPSGQPTVLTLRNYISTLIQTKRFYPDLVVVDYLDILRSTKHYDSEYEEQGQISVELRGMAGEFDFCLWTASQGNKSSYKKDVLDPTDMADSWKKAMVADVMLGLMQSEEEANLNKARVSLMLLRDADNTDKRVIPITFNKKKMLITGCYTND